MGVETVGRLQTDGSQAFKVEPTDSILLACRSFRELPPSYLAATDRFYIPGTFRHTYRDQPHYPPFVTKESTDC